MVGIASSDEICENLADDSGELEPVTGESSSDMYTVVVGMAAEQEMPVG